jgi:hypothetical protein
MKQSICTVVRDDGVAGSNPATPRPERIDTRTTTPEISEMPENIVLRAWAFVQLHRHLFKDGAEQEACQMVATAIWAERERNWIVADSFAKTAIIAQDSPSPALAMAVIRACQDVSRNIANFIKEERP